MAVTKLILFASALLLTALFIGVNASRSNETWHEHAVENPDEVAAMVDM
jgi:pectate lyase